MTTTSPVDASTCPVAALAEDAAATRRLFVRLSEKRSEADRKLIQRLDARDDGVTTGELLDACTVRLHAAHDMASHRRAASTKGALFQLIVLADLLTGLDDQVVPRSTLPARTVSRLDAWREEARRLLYSATAYLEGQAASDADLDLLRAMWRRPEYDVTAELEALADIAA